MAAGRDGGERYTTPAERWSTSATRRRTSREDSSTQQATERSTNIESKKMDVLLYRKVMTPPILWLYRRTEEGCRQRWRLNWAKSKRRMLKLIGNRENCKH